MTYHMDVSAISVPLESPALRVLSLGAGVQSSTLLLMAEHGHIEPRPDFAVFADTGWEPEATYLWLEKLERLSSIPIIRALAGNIKTDLLKSAAAENDKPRFASIPVFTQGGDMARRQCTREYKIGVITQAIRKELGVAKRKKVPKGTQVEVWIGISTDEIARL